MSKLKPGYKTTEFVVTILGHVIAGVVAGGLLTQAQGSYLETQLASIVGGIVAIIAVWRMAQGYGELRTSLKHDAQGKPALPAELNPAAQPASPAETSGGQPRWQIPLALACLLVLPALAPGQARPAVQEQLTAGAPACFPWRQRDQGGGNAELLRQIIANQQRLLDLIASQQLQRQQVQPAPQIIYLTPPQQQIPLGGPPRQDVPLGGPPRQDVPLGGPPLQRIEIGGQPYQLVPIGGAPRQQIDPGSPTPPGQQIPLGPQAPARPSPIAPPPNGQPAPGPMGPPTQYQRFAPASAGAPPSTATVPEYTWSACQQTDASPVIWKLYYRGQWIGEVTFDGIYWPRDAAGLLGRAQRAPPVPLPR